MARPVLVLAAAGAIVLFAIPRVLDAIPLLVDVREPIQLGACAAWLLATVVLLTVRHLRSRTAPGKAARVEGPDARPTGSGDASDATNRRVEATVLEPPTTHSGAEPVRVRGNLAGLTPGGAPIETHVGRVAAQRYQLTRELGRGGMGVVYLATDTVLQREVALKELPLHLGGATDLSKRFRQEARVLAKLSHPCIVQVFDLVEDEGRLWIALEFVRGGTLADAMRYAGGALAWPEVARIGRQVAEGLAFAHAQGVIHRDIKPMNVLVTDARPPLAKLTDFGLARLVESTEHTQPGSLLGSARYMSPEQVAGRPADARSDLYALGVTLFEMLTGRVPFEGEFAAVLARHASETPPDVRTLAPDVPQALAELVASLLAKAPEDRPRDAALVAKDLEALASGGGEERQAA